MSDFITHDHSGDGIDRRGFLRCMAWAGTGMLWTIAGGVLTSRALRGAADLDGAIGDSSLFFVQISDSHIGFDKPANTNVTATLQEAIRRIDALPREPAFLLHTGDISQLSKPDEFDTAQQVIRTAKTKTGHVFYVPGEHDVLGDDGATYLARYGKGAGRGWYSFDYQGVHFVALVNVLDLEPGGLGKLGREQLEWLERDVRHLSSSTPIVVFAHVPLWAVYPTWGWGTDDGALALSYLKRFGSVTVLNGHIHQVVQKIEGNMSFHTALSTAFPQPAPGAAPSPGPLKVPAERLRDFLGLTSVNYVAGTHQLAVVDATLSGAAVGAAQSMARMEHDAARAPKASAPAVANEVAIDNFTFAPPALAVAAGTRVTWVNRDDVPHQIVSTDRRFASSPVLDTTERYSCAFAAPGTYRYFCSIHPRMTGTITVR
ncbi:MAG TPA: metallophosphoesterase [Gemmatimonadaceae bacterium]